MLKVDVLATILVQAHWVCNMVEGRAVVINEFNRHHPRHNISVWNTHIGEHCANNYIAKAVAVRPDRIRFDQAFDELDEIV